MRGKKGERHGDPRDPPRRRANKRKGHGTSDTERPPVVGTVGRRTGRCRLRVQEHTDRVTLCRHIHTFTQRAVHCHTDEWPAYHQIQRRHSTVSHGDKEWARDDDHDGIREVHVNTLEGLWTTVRNFLRPFRGVHKKYLQDYLAMCEHRINRKRISPAFIAGLVAVHKTCT